MANEPCLVRRSMPELCSGLHFFVLLGWSWWCSTTTSMASVLEPGCKLVSFFFDPRFSCKLGFTDMMEWSSDLASRTCKQSILSPYLCAGVQLKNSQRHMLCTMCAALSDALSAAVAAAVNVERQTLGFHELFQSITEKGQGCLTTSGQTKPIRTPSWLLLRVAFAHDEIGVGLWWFHCSEERDSEVNRLLGKTYCVVERIGINVDGLVAVCNQTDHSRKIWSKVGGQPLKTFWHRLVFLLSSGVIVLVRSLFYLSSTFLSLKTIGQTPPRILQLKLVVILPACSPQSCGWSPSFP